MQIRALRVWVLAIGAGVTGLYSEPDEGRNEIMCWFFLVLLAAAAASVFVHIGLRGRTTG